MTTAKNILRCAAALIALSGAAPAAELDAYQAKWREAAEAAVVFGAIEMRRDPLQPDGLGAGVQECRAPQRRLDQAVVSLIAAEAPDEWMALHWAALPLFEELVTASAIICDGKAAGDDAEVASGWAWVRSIENMLKTRLANLPK